MVSVKKVLKFSIFILLFFSLFYSPASSFRCDAGSLETTCILSTFQNLDNNFSVSGTGNLVIESTASLNTNGNDLGISMTGFIENRGDINTNLSPATVRFKTGTAEPFTDIGLVGDWNFNEGSGNIARDAINGNNGTVYGATWQPSSVQLPKKSGSAIAFDGNDDYIDIGDISLLENFSYFSLSAWIKPSKLSTPPFFSGFSYFRPVTVSNSGSALTDYQVLVTINTSILVSAGKMRSDCADMRFSDSDNATSLSYWLESGCNSTTTKVWVKIPSIPNGNKTIYFYYGNSSASSGSTTSTLEAYQNTGDLDSEIKSVYYPNNNYVGDLHWTIGGWGDYYYALFKVPSSLRPSSVTSANINTATLYSYGFYQNENSGSTLTQTVNLAYITSSWNPSTVTWNTRPSQGSTFFTGSTVQLGPSQSTSATWHTFNITTWAKDSSVGWFGTNHGIYVIPSTNSGMYYRGYSANHNPPWYIVITYDTSKNIIIEKDSNGFIWRTRKYSSPEPSASIGSEQTTGSAQFVVGKEGVYKIEAYGNNIRFFTGNNWSGAILTSQSTLSTNAWQHIVATYDGSTKKLYINGVLDSNTVSVSGSVGQNSRKFSIGASDTGTAWANYFNGFIDEVRVYNRALSIEEVQQLYNSSKPEDAVLHLKFDEGTGLIASDSSAYGNHGLLYNFHAPRSTGWTSDAIDGNALEFDGVDDYVKVSDSNTLKITSSLTVEGWFKPDSSKKAPIKVLSIYPCSTCRINDILGSYGLGLFSVECMSYTAFNSGAYNLAKYDVVILDGADCWASAANLDLEERNAIVSFVLNGGAFISTHDTICQKSWPEFHQILGYDCNGGYTGCYPTGCAALTPVNRTRVGAITTYPYVLPASISVQNTHTTNGQIPKTAIRWYELTADDSGYDVYLATNTYGAGYGRTAMLQWGHGAYNCDCTGGSLPGADESKLIVNTLYWAAMPRTIFKQNSYGLYVDSNFAVGYINETVVSSNLSSTTWAHVALTYDLSNVSLYVNGVLKSTQTLTDTIALNANDLFVGKNFFGKIDDVRVYNRALSQAEIAADMRENALGKKILHLKMDEENASIRDYSSFNNHGWLGGSTSLLMRFDENSGYIAQDSSGYGNTGTIYGNTVLLMNFDDNTSKTIKDLSSRNNNGILYGSTRLLMNMDDSRSQTIVDSTGYANNGNYRGSSLFFDGLSAYVQRSSPSNIPTGNTVTVTVWIKPDSLQGDASYNGIVSWGPRTGTGTSFLFSLQNNGRLSMGTWNNNFVPSSGPTVRWNEWNFVAVVLDGQSVTLYVNGESVNGTLSSTPAIQSGVLNVGSTDNPGRYFKGNIDELRIYSRALSSTEILEQMRGIFSNNAGLRVLWYFKEGSGTSVADDSGNGNTGTLMGGASWQDVIVNWNTPHCYADSATYSSGSYNCPSGTTTFKVYHYVATEGCCDSYYIYSGGGVKYSGAGCLTGGTCSSGNCNAPSGAWSAEYSYSGPVSFTLTTDSSIVYYGVRVDKISCYVPGSLPTWSTESPAIWQSSSALANEGGSALAFNGIDTYVEVPHTASLYLNNQVSVEAWVNLKSFNSSDWGSMIVSKYGGNWKGYNLYLANTTGKPAFSIATTTPSNAIYSVISDDAISLNSWTHIVGVWDGSTAHVYVNGVLKKSVSAPYITQDATPLYIGKNAWSGYGFLNGLIDEVAIHGRALTQAEILDHYTSRKAKFSDWNAGMSGTALQFDGNSYVYIGDSSSLDITNKISIEAWVYANTYGKSKSTIPGNLESANILSKMDTPTSCTGPFWWEYRNNGILDVYFRNTSGSIIYVRTNLPIRQWYHIVATYDSSTGTAKVYLNGVDTNTVVSSGFGQLRNGMELLLGTGKGINYGNSFDGKLDELVIYSKVLSQAEIFEHYIAGKARHADWVSGKNGSALQFPGLGEYVEVATSTSIAPTELSLSAWINVTQTASYNILFAKDYTSHSYPYYSYQLRTTPSGIEWCCINLCLTYSGGALPTNSWQHIAATCKSGEQKIYLNGVAVASSSTTGSIVYYNTNLLIGKARNFDGRFFGIMDEVAIYSKILSANEISKLYVEGRARHSDFNSGISGKAIQFDGVDDIVSIPDSDSLDMKNDSFSIFAWVKRNKFNDEQQIVAKYGSIAYNGYRFEFGADNKLGFFAGDGGSWDIYLQSSSTITDSGWHHVGVVINRSSVGQLYIDGKPNGNAASATSIGNINNADPVYIGSAQWSTKRFGGIIDDVRIYNYAKSAQEIEADYNFGVREHSAHIQITDQNLVALWHLDGNAMQTTALDSKGSNHGTLANFDFWHADSGWVEGKFGRALRFDGNNDYIAVNDSSLWDFRGKNVSIEVWFKASSVQIDPWPTLLDHFVGGTPGAGWRLGFDYNKTKIVFAHRHDGTGDQIYLVSTKDYADNQWHHVVVVLDNGIAKLYLDGLLDKTDSYANLNDHDAPLYVGGQGISYSFNGSIDEIAIYHRALSETEIKDHYYSFVDKGMIYSAGTIKGYGENQ
ncbi:MAG: DUF2341 domain-containing protein [Candidatus Diapherotrites archaeon]